MASRDLPADSRLHLEAFRPVQAGVFSGCEKFKGGVQRLQPRRHHVDDRRRSSTCRASIRRTSRVSTSGTLIDEGDLSPTKKTKIKRG